MNDSYYASTAYSPASIPDQPPSRERSWLRKLGGSRLPWGRIQEVAPEYFIHCLLRRRDHWQLLADWLREQVER